MRFSFKSQLSYVVCATTDDWIDRIDSLLISNALLYFVMYPWLLFLRNYVHFTNCNFPQNPKPIPNILNERRDETWKTKSTTKTINLSMGEILFLNLLFCISTKWIIFYLFIKINRTFLLFAINYYFRRRYRHHHHRRSRRCSHRRQLLPFMHLLQKLMS